MELCSSSEAASLLATQEFPRILWKLNVPYCVHKNPPLVCNLSHTNPVYTTPPYLAAPPLFHLLTTVTWGRYLAFIPGSVAFTVYANGMGCPSLSLNRKRLKLQNIRYLVIVKPKFMTYNNNNDKK
jgi:hypothetical protein